MLESSPRELQDCFKPHPNWRSEQEVMDAQNPGSPTRDSFGTPPWESREKVLFGCSPRGELQRTRERGGEVVAPSNIREIQKVQGGKVMPPDGGIVLPKNVQVKPLFPKS